MVVDDGVDTGPIIAQVPVPVLDDDDVETLHERIKVSERTMLVEWVGRLVHQALDSPRSSRPGPGTPARQDNPEETS
jgi:phosphoribosylglycinamide formyltransferase-1